AAFLIAYLWACKPNKPELDRVRGEEQKLLSQLEQKARKAANLDAYRAQLAEMEQSFGACCASFPTRPKCRTC
ncbi:type 4a pilus biogenesis protein PilO, partial [Salmonella enterica]|uniref:type 4a pilus biogenesis protein PilO n=1 Tax=Salmonella enterica TaxID=28901 RepID=UPI0032991481